MNSIEFFPSTSLSLESRKRGGHPRVVACHQLDTAAGKEPELCALFLDDKKSELRVWCERMGTTTLRGAGKYATRIVDVACDGLFTALFFHHDKGRRLGLAVMHHSSCKPARLSAEPADYSSHLDDVLAPLVPNERKGKEETSLLRVHNSCLKQTASGLVLAFVLSTPTGELHMLIGALRANIWKRFRLEKMFRMPACLCIQSERVISFMGCSVGPPVDQTITTVAPTVELALSVFDQARGIDGDDDGDYEKKKNDPNCNTNSSFPQISGASCCVLLHESIFSLDDRDAVINVCYQSQRFRISEVDEGGRTNSSCYLYADGDHKCYTAVMALGAWSYMVNLQRSSLNMELIAHCRKIGIQGIPRGVAWLYLPHNSRPDVGVRAVVLLSQDYRLYAAEMFGDTFSVQVIGSPDGHADVVQFKQSPTSSLSLTSPRGHKESMSATAFSACFTHLLRVSDNKLLCFNGILGVVLRVTSCSVDANVPQTISSCSPFIGEDCTSPERRVTLLLRSLEHLEKLSNLERPKLLQSVFQWVLPMLQCGRPSQHEVFLTQRVFQALLRVAAPQSAEEWRVMWSLTKVFQKMLSKRCRDSTVVYTDLFFIQLVGKHLRSREAADEKELAEEVLLSVVSEELKRTWQSFEQQADENASFVLDCLAERVAPISLAEECVRRMVVVSTLSNGTHVVSARANTSHIIHAVATTLLASCLSVPVFVDTDDAGWLACHTSQSGYTSVFVQPHSLKEGVEFDYALALSTDLFCVMTPEGRTLPCAAALFSMLLARRYHVVSSFLQVFALPLADHLTPLEPLCNNACLLADCSAAVPLTESALFKSILSNPTPSAILHVLCNGSMIDDYFNVTLWRHIKGILSTETQGLVIAAVLHAMTDRVIAAQNNYSTSLVKALLRGDFQHSIREEVSVLACRKRLGVVLTRLEHLWACVDAWSPYKVVDVASSVIASSTVGQNVRSAGTPPLNSGSVVSRIYVVCFRILSLVGYSYRTEEYIEEQMLMATTDSTIIRAAFAFIRAIGNLKGTALPVEYLQWRCVDLAAMSEATCVQTPGLAGFLLEMLQLSGVSLTTFTPLKQYYYLVVDRLTEVAQGDVTVLHELHIQLREINEAVSSATSAFGSETTYFLWSRSAGADFPNWPGDHNLEARRYLINTKWVDAMWPVEFVAHLLEECVSHAQERVLKCDTADGPAVEEPSQYFSQALFHHLCTLSPPVRTHALLAPVNATPAMAGRQSPDRSPRLSDVTGARALLPPASVPQPAQQQPRGSPVSTFKVNSSSVVIPFCEMVNDDFLTTDSSSSSSSVRDAHTETQSPPRPSGVVPHVDVVAAAARAALSQFPPNSVAWWETGDDLDPVSKKERVIMEALEGIDIEITGSATSYTTETSKNCVYHHKADARSTQCSTAFSPRRCKRHDRRHYHCAKHRSHEIDIGGHHHHTKLSRREQVTKGSHSACVVSSASPREKTATGVRLLRFQSVLQPPPLPLKMVDEFHVQSVQPQPSHPASDMAPPQLLSLHAKPRVPRVSFFAFSGADGAGEGPGVQNRATTGSSLGFFTKPSSPLQLLDLAPPPLPPSSVFTHPPPLLKLKLPTAMNTIPENAARSPIVEKGLLQHEDYRITDDDELLISTAPSAPVFDPAPAAGLSPGLHVAPVFTAPLSEEKPTVRNILVPSKTPSVPLAMSLPPPPPPHQQQQQMHPQQLKYPLPSSSFDNEARRGFISGSLATTPFQLREGREELAVGLAQPPKPQVNSISAAPEPVVIPTQQVVPPVSSLREPVLSPSENVAFRNYVDELKVAAQAAGLPPQVPNPVQQPLAAMKTNMREQKATTQSLESHEQHRELLTIVKETLAQHEEQHSRQFRAVMEAVRVASGRPTSPLARAETQPVGGQTSGLSSIQQAELLRHTIQQKDRLMMMNQDLLELHGRIQHHVPALMSEQVHQPAVSCTAPVAEDKHHLISTSVPPHAPLRFDAATSVGTGEVAAKSSGVQVGKGMKEMEDASTMVVGASRDPPREVVPDIYASMNIDRTFSNIQRINADLVRVNATADDMERAIRDSRNILNKHSSLGSAYSASVEGSLMMDAARRRTAALEQQLIKLNATSVSSTLMGAAQEGAVVPEKQRGRLLSSPEKEEKKYEEKREVPLRQNTYLLTAVEDHSGGDATTEAAIPTALPSSRFCFTSESVEINEDTADHAAFPFTVQEGMEHVFQLQSEEALCPEARICDAEAADWDSHLHLQVSRPNTAEPTVRTRSLSPPNRGDEAALQRLVKCGSLSSGQVMDLKQLYSSAQSARERHSMKKPAGFSKNQKKVVSSSLSPRAVKPVPERFAMYLPATRSKKTHSGSGGDMTGFTGSVPHKGSMTAQTTRMETTGLTETMISNRGDRKIPSSSRDIKRRDTLALHTARRLAEFQRAFL